MGCEVGVGRELGEGGTGEGYCLGVLGRSRHGGRLEGGCNVRRSRLF